MVFFALSRSGYESFCRLGGPSSPLWVCAGVLSESDLSSLRASGVDVSDFEFTLEPDDYAGIGGAIETIKEHHPGHTVWVSY